MLHWTVIIHSECTVRTTTTVRGRCWKSKAESRVNGNWSHICSLYTWWRHNKEWLSQGPALCKAPSQLASNGGYLVSSVLLAGGSFWKKSWFWLFESPRSPCDVTTTIIPSSVIIHDIKRSNSNTKWWLDRTWSLGWGHWHLRYLYVHMILRENHHAWMV